MAEKDESKQIGKFQYYLIDETTLTLKGAWIVCSDSRRIDALLKELDGKRYDDPATYGAVGEVIRLTVIGWTEAEPFTYEALANRLSRRELASLAFLAPAAIADLEVAVVEKLGARKTYYHPDGRTILVGFENNPPEWAKAGGTDSTQAA